MSEYEYAEELNAARIAYRKDQESRIKTAGKAAKVKQALSFGKKISKHWPILIVAGLFDIPASIPFIGIIFNFAFAGILFLYFGPKSKSGEGSELQKIVLPVFIGSILDFIISFLPVCLGAAVVRIALSKDRKVAAEEEKNQRAGMHQTSPILHRSEEKEQGDALSELNSKENKTEDDYRRLREAREALNNGSYKTGTTDPVILAALERHRQGQREHGKILERRNRSIMARRGDFKFTEGV